MFFKPVPLKCNLPTSKHTCTHGRGQNFCATVSKICQHTPHTVSHLRRKITVKRSRHLSRFFTRGGALEGRNKRSHLKSSLLARGENGNLIYMLYFISLFQIWIWLSATTQQYARVRCHICLCWFPVTWQAVGAWGGKKTSVPPSLLLR